MDPGDPQPDFASVVDSVMYLFGEVMSREAVSAIVEHYGGDLDQSIDAIMAMSDDQVPASPLTPSAEPSQPAHIVSTLNENAAEFISAYNAPAATSHPVSYAVASQSSRTGPRQDPNPKALKPKQTPKKIKHHSIWTLQTKQIVGYHAKGSRTLILLRGVPGSGKSYLAEQLLLAMCPEALYESHILSTDDFFYNKQGKYEYVKSKLPEAHNWNLNRAIKAMREGLSPIFIDNTNVEIWEMQPYVKEGVINGYIIEVLEPSNPWSKKPHLLATKNSHGVHIGTIRRMLDNFQNGISGLLIMRSLSISYSPGMTPPVLRSFPPILPRNPPTNPPPNPPPNPPRNPPPIPPRNPPPNSPRYPPPNPPRYPPPNPPRDPPPNPPPNPLPNPPAYPPRSSPPNPLQQEQSAPPPSILANVAPAAITSINPAIVTTVTQPIDVAPPRPSNSENIAVSSAGTESMAVSSSDAESSTENPDQNDTAVDDLAKRFHEIEYAWDNGESWDVDGEGKASGGSQNRSSCTPKPPRPSKNTVPAEKLLPSTANYSDWTNISMFMPAWNDYQNTDTQASPTIRVETATKSTSVEFGDTDMNTKNLKILIGTPKDINFYYTGSSEEKIPEKRMLDKSTTTNDNNHIISEISRCKNEEKHFAAFRKLFKNISKVELRDIFDKCLGDVNWAVDIVLDGMANSQLQTIDTDDISDPEDFGDDQCECLAAYNIIPSINTQTVTNASNPLPEPEPIAGPSNSRFKKDKVVLESSIQLKRQIEKNVVISDSHYSDHCLKIRKMRRGEVNHTRADSPEEGSGASTSAAGNATTDTITETGSIETDEETSSSASDEGERTINVDLGSVFVSELDAMFGRDDMHYPENLETRINMPVSLLNEINALWIESLMYQLDQQSRQSEMMLRQDEEFARQLALKEEELARAGQEPAIPDLKEIMDMELALSIYKREITAEWRNNEPNDLAARMTREKLYNLFPDVQADVLSELLMAHDNNFQATVEVLLSSTGNAQVLAEPNGLTKFIAKKELERQEKILAEQKKALSDVEWPLLPKDTRIDMVTVQKYRAKASEHLNQRNMYYEKAQEFFNRDMTQVATYYSDVAVLHKKKYDQANSLAAASLMQLHAANCPDNATIDLHFLHVPEARESLDLFIDTHIKKLRDSAGRPGPRFHSLFFITGRGLHSRGGPRIKPAVKRRLKERGIAFGERNPGLLASKVCAEDKMTFELS